MTGQSARMSFLIRQVQLRIYNQMLEGLGKFDLTPFQYMALSLASHNGRWSTAELARRFQITPQSMNEVVAALEAKELISRRESPDHRRILHVRLTSAGTRLLQKCDAEIDRIEGNVFADFTAAQITEFRETLGRALARTSDGASEGLRGSAAVSSRGGRMWSTT